MPRETLRALDQDVERLMLAGATAAAGDDGLAARKSSLEGFAAKAPALAKVAEQVGRVTGAKGRAVTTELLNLGAVVTQLRGAQAAPGATAGDLRDLPRTIAIDTPLSYHQIEPLLRALTETGGERLEVIKDAVDRGLVRDLRLIDPWLAALSDGNVGELVAEKAVPALGEVAVARLEGALKLDGGATDARRLECVVTLKGEASRALILRALEEGAPKVRAAAIAGLATIDPAAAEPVALKLLASDKAAEVRVRAVAAALALGRSDEVLAALLNALGDDNAVRATASEVLGRSPHPQAGARLLALLTPEVLDIKPYAGPKPKRGVKLTPAQVKAAEKEQQAAMRKVDDRTQYVGAVLHALVLRREPAGIAKLVELYRAHTMPQVRYDAGRGLAALDPCPPEVLAAFAAVLDDPDTEVVEIAVNAMIDRDPKLAFDKLSPYFTEAEITKKNSRGAFILERVVYYRFEDEPTLAVDPRWTDIGVRLLDSKSDQARNYALSFLSQRKDPRVFAPALKLLGAKETWFAGLQALEALGDKRAVPEVLKLLDQKYAQSSWYYLEHALRAFDDVAALPKLNEEIAREKKKKKPETYRINRLEELARYLSRDRTLA